MAYHFSRSLEKDIRNLAKKKQMEPLELVNFMVVFALKVFKQLEDPDTKSVLIRKKSKLSGFTDTQISMVDWGEKEPEDPEFSIKLYVEHITKLTQEFMESLDLFEGNAEIFGFDKQTTERIKKALLKYIETKIETEFLDLESECK